MEHPDPTGPESQEEPGAAHDGAPNGRKSVAEEAEESAPAIPEAPPLKGDGQLTLAGLGRRGQPIESTVSLMSAAVPVDGLIDAETEGQLLVAYLPAGYKHVPVREGSGPEVKRWKLVQQLRPVHIQKVTPEIQAAIEAVNAEHELEPTTV